ncbi:DUF6226 family protein [Microbacterium sp. ZW T5_45]|uniref:DUF6226 family protein n=1 Tax=Microbacterium sp. ZW T5_45 TaxID=3378080 RepID=UPI003851BC06
MAAELFPEPLAPMPSASTGMILIPSDPRPAPPRFVDGIDAFVAFARAADTDPALLAIDLSALWSFIAEHPEILEDAELADSGTRFLGNAIAVRHPAATWRATPAAEIGTSTRSVPVADLLRIIVEHPERLEPFLDMFADWAQDDADDAELRALTRDRTAAELVVPAAPFVRPALPTPEFRDDHGQVIEYGARWSGPAPEEAYSRVSHPERFAPLLLMVDALIEHLAGSYLVDVDRRTDAEGALVVHLRPSTGAAITLTATVEGVRLQAGALFRETVPDCTCDACDESAETEAGHLEETLLSIAAGGLRELFPLGNRGWGHIDLLTVDGGGRSSDGPPDPGLTDAQLSEVAEKLRGLDDGWWPAWTLRTGSS